MQTKVLCRFVVTFCVATIMLSCSVKELRENELKEYLLDEENGLHKRVVKNGVEIDFTYKPSELVWKSELETFDDEDKRQELKRKYDTLNYFTIRFCHNGKEIENAFASNPSQFSDVVSYLSSGMNKDVLQISGSDTTRALDVIYTQTFGGSNATTVMAVFSGNLKEQTSDIQICFNDSKLNIGDVSAEFKSDDIKNIPTLIIH